MGTLKATALAKLPVGKHSDGDGLILVKGARKSSWTLRIQIDGRRVDRGLGSLDTLSLAQAREKAGDIRKALKSGEARPEQVRKGEVRGRHGRDTIPTFSKAAASTYDALSPGWKNDKHKAGWKAALANHVTPTIGDLRVDDVRPGDVADALRAIWREKPDAARKALSAVAQVLTYGMAKGWCDQPLATAAVLRLLPKQPKRDAHYKSLGHEALPKFMANLRSQFSTGRVALEMTILTACRSGEVRGARWDEFDMEALIWTIPAARMKGGKAHRVPVTPAMAKLLEKARLISRGDLVFHGRNPLNPLSDMTLVKVLRDMEIDAVPHGFRSTFKRWAVECQPDVPNHVSEQALAHVVGNVVERAYRRDAEDFAARRRLMEAWANHAGIAK